MKHTLKRSLAVVIAAITIIGFCAFYFAAPVHAAEANTTTHETRLYKDGKFDITHPDDNLSMGDGAVLDSQVTKINDNEYKITVNFKKSFWSYGMKGSLKKVDVLGNVWGKEYTKEDKAITSVSFRTNTMDYPQIFKTEFTINIFGIMPKAAVGDIVIF